MAEFKPDTKRNAFLGTGWSFPPTFSRATLSVEMVSDEQDIRESLWTLFSTRTGERVMLPEYGTPIWQMVFASINTTLLTQLEDFIRTAIALWEPRIDLISINAQPDADLDGRILVTLEYIIRSTNARNNLVYPFYIEEGTLVAPVSG